MALNINGLFGHSIFESSAEDNQVLVYAGGKFIPGTVGSISQTKYPTNFSEDGTVGSYGWLHIDYVGDEDSSYASSQTGGINPMTDYSVKLVINGSIVGENRAVSTALSTSYADLVYGHTQDLWGLNPDYDQINSTGFGVVWSGVASGQITRYIKATDFDFNIPSTAIITGIKVTVRAKKKEIIPTEIQVDSIKITVFYVGVQNA